MEAESAMNSSEAVLANRFIRVFYHQDKPKVHQRLGPAAPAAAKSPEMTADIHAASAADTSPEVQKQKDLEKAAVSAFLYLERIWHLADPIRNPGQMSRTFPISFVDTPRLKMSAL